MSCFIKGLIIEPTLIYKIPPSPCLPVRQVPFPKGGIPPYQRGWGGLFPPSLSKRGRGDFLINVHSISRLLIFARYSDSMYLMIMRENSLEAKTENEQEYYVLS
jgi:hypothetical protein